jgi:hypothetical protein
MRLSFRAQVLRIMIPLSRLKASLLLTPAILLLLIGIAVYGVVSGNGSQSTLRVF